MDDQPEPVCVRCFKPVERGVEYCDCGLAVGPYTTWLPFVIIPFVADFWGLVLKRARKRTRPGPLRWALLTLILTVALVLPWGP